MIPADELRALSDRIIRSGELGRSRVYAAILQYLVEQAIAGTTPKEISIAMEVLGREADFDVGKDSVVRVHIYHLRNKLNTYFAGQGATEQYRIDIPKGQYLLSVSQNAAPAPGPAAEQAAGVSITGQPLNRRDYTPYLAGVALLLLLLNLWLPRTVPVTSPLAEDPLWRPLLDDDLPVLVLIGDYYIMGEDDSRGNVERMVREFAVNSAEELREAQANGEYAGYRNLDMSYAPTGSSKVLVPLLAILGAKSDRVEVKLMSELNTNDLVGHHVIYLGLLSGLRSLTDLMFAGSGLAIGSTYDELIDVETDAVYASSSGLSVGPSSYRDYGMVSTFPAPGGTQYLLLAGMRDEGLVNLAEELMDPANLTSLRKAELPETTAATAWEALFEVLGYDNTNFDAKLVYRKGLDTQVIWDSKLLGQP